MLALLMILATFTGAGTAHSDDRFVVVTDSHGVGHFGEELARWLRNRPATKFNFTASGASAPAQWNNGLFTTPCGFHDDSSIAKPEPRKCHKLLTPKLAAVWKRQGARQHDERRITVIVLGTNYGLDPSTRKMQLADTEKLATTAMTESDRCFWVGPPNMRRKHGFDADGVKYKVELVTEALAAAAKATGKPVCQLIDSRSYSHYPKNGDGIHYHWPGSTDAEQLLRSAEWADSVAKQIDLFLGAE
ncbi:MAG: hypothetical protein HY075_04255 [Deltaproteobacteria bacterium]|nr:hypothetical protein [Deltaproteobacteria bacterium]